MSQPVRCDGDRADRRVELETQTQVKIQQIDDKLAEQARKTAEAMEKPFRDAFDTIGQGITGIGADLLKIEPGRGA